MTIRKTYLFILLLMIAVITVKCESTIDIVSLNKYLTNISQKTTNIIQVYNQLTPEKNVQKFSQLVDFLNNETNQLFSFIQNTKFSDFEMELKNEIESKYFLQLNLFLKTLNEVKKNYQEPVQTYTRDNLKIWNNKVKLYNQRINSFIKVHNQLLITLKNTYSTKE